MFARLMVQSLPRFTRNLILYVFKIKSELVYVSKFQNVSAYILAQPSFWNCTWERFSFWIAGKYLNKNIFN